MPGMKKMRKLLHAIEKERGRKNIRVVPKAGRGKANEISPAIPAEAQYDGGEVHPGLKKVQPADVGLPKGGDAQHESKKASTHQNEALGSFEVRVLDLHDEARYAPAYREVPQNIWPEMAARRTLLCFGVPQRILLNGLPLLRSVRVLPDLWKAQSGAILPGQGGKDLCGLLRHRA